jgi:hypothetical protein
MAGGGHYSPTGFIKEAFDLPLMELHLGIFPFVRTIKAYGFPCVDQVVDSNGQLIDWCEVFRTPVALPHILNHLYPVS